MKRGLTWYKREPRAFLDGVMASRLTAKQIAVYGIILDLIYDGAGRTPNHPKYISGYFNDMGTDAVRKAISHLVSIGKLIADGDYLTQNRAQTETKLKANLSETRSVSGGFGGRMSGVSRRKINENSKLTEANAKRLDKSREDKEKVKRKRASRLDENWVLPDEWGDIATGMGLPQNRVQTEADKMREWSMSSPKGVKLDWLATWRSWIRRVVEDNPAMQMNGQSPDLVVLARDSPDFKAVEALRSKPIATGQKGTATFKKSEIEKAYKFQTN